MDGTDSNDYVSRVEPSVHAGSKISYCKFHFRENESIAIKIFNNHFCGTESSLFQIFVDSVSLCKHAFNFERLNQGMDFSKSATLLQFGWTFLSIQNR